MNNRRKSFVLVGTDHGTMIVNRMDYNHFSGSYYGVGYNLLEYGCFDPNDVNIIKKFLELRRAVFGDGVVAIDAGANVGVHTVEWARHMTGWGSVVAVEAQERVFYALAGNIVLNNCFNARALWAALSDEVSTIKIPKLNYMEPASFGSLELRKRNNNEFIGQDVDYSEDSMVEVQTKTIDSLGLQRVDLIKIDVEGMETEVLKGASKVIKEHKPLMFIEHIKTDHKDLNDFLVSNNYRFKDFGINIIAFHEDDKISDYIN